ncbi:hypothetical protein [Parasitella parasitica]|uniref:Homeobox domain-containing protein n=1 Tax=Parasitella parasitica TaxID=35722 RepID=A0A0B7NJ19_9FUNG|nr:hypothetical protein [Parasitella parasitica]
MSRRGSLAISALLNEDAIDPVTNNGHLRSRSLSSIKSGSASPTLSFQQQHEQEQHATSNQSQLTKAKRKRISPAQYDRLMEIFDQTDTPSSEIRENVAIELNMTKREVQVWFQNRRAKVNRSKNMNKRQRYTSMIPFTSNFYHSHSRRTSAHPILENNNVLHQHPQLHLQQPHPSNYNDRLCPIAPIPMPTSPIQEEDSRHPLQPSHYYSPYQQHKPSAIDLLASAAEYVRTDSKS